MFRRSSTFLKAIIIDGNEVKKVVKEQITKDLDEIYNAHIAHLYFIKQTSRPCELCDNYYRGAHHLVRTRPTLAMVCVGDNSPQTAVYIANKERTATQCGFHSKILKYPASISQEDLEKEIKTLDEDPTIHGIIVQRPIPPHLNPVAATSSVSPIKDVDGLHPSNIGLLHSRNSNPIHVPCTAMAVMRLLAYYNVPIVGKRACIIGASNIAGRPVSELLLSEGATVTTLGRLDSKLIESVVKKADILVTACGQKELIRGSMIKPGAAVLDVGTSPVPDATKPNGYRLVGDVKFDEAVEVAGWLTPVPGGVGPMTCSMLLENTLRAYQLCLDGYTSGELIKAAEELWTNSEKKLKSGNEASEKVVNDQQQQSSSSASACSSTTPEAKGEKFVLKKNPIEMHHHHLRSIPKPSRSGGPSPTSL